jgi:hypothetical protein
MAAIAHCQNNEKEATRNNLTELVFGYTERLVMVFPEKRSF